MIDVHWGTVGRVAREGDEAMARLFNVEVFNQTIGKGGAYYTGEEFASTLGSADTIFFQVIIDATTVDSTTVTVTFQTNNTTQQQSWADAGSAGYTVATTAAAPKQFKLVVPGSDSAIGAYGRLKITSNQDAASVRIIACGRSL